MLDAIRQYARALERSTGPSRVKDALQLQEIEDYIELPTATELYTGDTQEALWPAGLVVLGSWWMTRSIEATAATEPYTGDMQEALWPAGLVELGS